MATVESVENAIRAWVKTSSGYPDARVFFLKQKVEWPDSDPFITIHIDAPVPLGAFDAVRDDYDEDRDAGSEMRLEVVGERSVTAHLQVRNAATTGAPSAVSVMAAVQLGLSLPSTREALSAAGVSPYDVGAVQDLSELLGTAFNGRAAMDVRLYCRLTLAEYTTWIERVQGTVNGVGYEINLAEDLTGP